MKTIATKIAHVVWVQVFQCLRCGHIWMPREDIDAFVPKNCPECHSPYWNKPRIRKRSS